MEGPPVPPKYGGAPIHPGRVFVGAEHAHFLAGVASEEARKRGVQVGSGPVPKIVPSGGLFPFGSRVAREQQTRMNTGESKVRQIWLKC